jgi:hypothetical protein
MKKFIAILVFCCYTAGVFGMDISLHYCGGSFHSISFKTRDDNGCCGKKKKKMRCCKDKNLSYKLSEKHAAQHIVHHHYDTVDFAAVLPETCFFYQSPYTASGNDYIPVSHAPPDIRGPGLYLLYNVFLI